MSSSSTSVSTAAIQQINTTALSLNAIHKLLSNNDKGLVDLALRRKLIGVEPPRFRLLFSSLSLNTTVRTLDVAQNNLDEAAIHFMTESLIKNQTIQNLDFSGNSITDVQPFLKLVRRNIYILEMKLFDPALEQPPASLTKAINARIQYFLQANSNFHAVRQGHV